MKIQAKRFDTKLPLPQYLPEDAAGFDLASRVSVQIDPGETKAVPLNIAIKVPKGYALLLLARSSTFGKFGLIMPHSVGVVDPYYSRDENELVAIFHNLGKKVADIQKGAHLVHGILIKSERVEFDEVKSLGKGIEPGWDSSILDKGN